MAFWVLKKALPQWAAWFDRVFDTIVFDPTDENPTPRALAHVFSKKYESRAVVFVQKPSSLNLADLVEVLRHESEHVAEVDAAGTNVLNPHTVIVGNRVDQVRDPIYAHGQHYRPAIMTVVNGVILHRQIKEFQKNPPAPEVIDGAMNFLESVAKVAFVVGLVVVSVRLLGVGHTAR